MRSLKIFTIVSTQKYFISTLFILFIIFISSTCSNDSDNLNAEQDIVRMNEFGLIVDSLVEFKGVVQRNETLTDILLPHNISYLKLIEIVEASKNIFDVRKINRGKNYFIYSLVDSIETVKYFVYKKDPINYFVIDLSDSIIIYKREKEVSIRERKVSGVINNSLYKTLKEKNVDDELALELSEVFAWQIDFYRIQKGDEFKVIFNEEYIDDELVGIGQIKSAYFKHWKEDFYGFYFEQNDEGEYFDEEGKSLRKAFLKSPLKFSRISSGYSNKRFHPVLKRYKAHLGTDYAAPKGTRIYSVGDGVVTEAQYKRNNGNYVKIRHNGTYTTQYLHMSKIASGIKPGVKVKQKQVIGFVGSTGLATGPHVCFRFWKNGQQVNHRREKFPSSHPVLSEYLSEYQIVKDSLKRELDSMQIYQEEIQVAEKK